VGSFWQIWRRATLHRLEHLLARVLAIVLTSHLKTSHARSLTVQRVTFFGAVHDLVTKKIITCGIRCVLEIERDCTFDTLTIWVLREFTICLTSELVSGVWFCARTSHGVTLLTSYGNNPAEKRAA
jgi:phosphoribosyl-AMP cyclohydrolase